MFVNKEVKSKLLHIFHGIRPTQLFTQYHISCRCNYLWTSKLNAFLAILINPFAPRAINFKFPLQLYQEYYFTMEKTLVFIISLLRWKIIILPILTTSFRHISLKSWENVRFELGSAIDTCAFHIILFVLFCGTPGKNGSAEDFGEAIYHLGYMAGDFGRCASPFSCFPLLWSASKI